MEAQQTGFPASPDKIGRIVDAFKLPSDVPTGNAMKVAAAMSQDYVRAVDPDNKKWRPGNPRWDKVQERVTHDMEPAVSEMLEQIRREFRNTMILAYMNVLTDADADEVLAFMKTDEGKRFLDFENRLDMALLGAMSELEKAMSGKAAMPALTEDVLILRPRLRLIALARSQRLLAHRMEMEQRNGDHGGGSAFTIMARIMATLGGPALDDLNRQYGDDLARFDQIADSPSEKKIMVASSSLIEAWGLLVEQAKRRLDAVKNARLPEWKSYYAELVAIESIK